MLTLKQRDDFMSISPLATYQNLTSKCNVRQQPITKITIHHMAGKMTGKECADYFCRTSRQVSANYCIGYNGDIAANVDEQYRPWTSSSAWNDHRAVTIEVSNSSTTDPEWPISDASMDALINLCVDICKRNGIKYVQYTGDKNGSLTFHCMYSNTDCPGPYIKKFIWWIAEQINNRLNAPVCPYEMPTRILNGNNAAYKKKYAGNSGVKWIQWHMQRAGLYHDQIDGFYGPKTTEAVRAFQKMYGLEADGSTGPITRAAIAERIK